MLTSQLRKYTMLAVKGIVGCVPRSFRLFLKRSPALTSFYSRNLQKSGLFYGFPSRKKLEELYKNNISHQNSIIDSFDQTPRSNTIPLVIVGKNAIPSLLRSLHSIKVAFPNYQQTVILCASEENIACRNLLESNGYAELGKNLITDIKNEHSCLFDSQMGIFAFYAGHLVHPRILSILSNSIDLGEIVYFDSDKIDSNHRHSPEFLPNWSLDLQLSTAYIKTGVLFQNSSNLTTQNLSTDDESIAFLLVKMGLSQRTIAHQPLVAIHAEQTQKFSMDKYANLLAELFDKKCNLIENRRERTLTAKWSTESDPLVSLIIPTKNGKELVQSCIDSIVEKSSYKNYEILLIDNQSDDPTSRQYFKELSDNGTVRLLEYNKEFNYSAINNFAVKEAKGTIVGLINNDIEVISSDWLELMVGHALRQDVGCVGAKLLYPDERVQHAGVVLGYGGGAGHAHKYFPRYHPGYLNRLNATGNYCAVTAACLLVKKQDYISVGGLDEISFKVAFNDVDFCLKVLELGRRNVYCAEAELFHHESITRGFDDTHAKRARFEFELGELKTRWSKYIKSDPYYNQNLTLRRENFAIQEIEESLS